MTRKGIATQTIFLIVIGLAVVGLVVALVVTNVGSVRSSTSCRLAQNNFCEDWQNTGSQPTWSEYDPPEDCSDSDGPSPGQCEGMGYDTE